MVKILMFHQKKLLIFFLQPLEVYTVIMSCSHFECTCLCVCFASSEMRLRDSYILYLTCFSLASILIKDAKTCDFNSITDFTQERTILYVYVCVCVCVCVYVCVCACEISVVVIVTCKFYNQIIICNYHNIIRIGGCN